jgi:hypothetical protein
VVLPSRHYWQQHYRMSKSALCYRNSISKCHPRQRNIRPALSLGWGIKGLPSPEIHIQLLIESIRIYMIDKFWRIVFIILVNCTHHNRIWRIQIWPDIFRSPLCEPYCFSWISYFSTISIINCTCVSYFVF